MATEKWWLVGLGALSFYFLQAVKGPGKGYIRPPGAMAEEAFLATCLRCGQCAQICPHKSIEILGAEAGVSIGTPAITNPRKAPCYLCMDCIKVCPSRALVDTAKEDVRMGLAQIDRERCLTWQKDECKVCYVSCPFIGTAMVLEDYLKTVIKSDKCTGCGICQHVCVLHPPAITVVPRS